MHAREDNNNKLLQLWCEEYRSSWRWWWWWWWWCLFVVLGVSVQYVPSWSCTIGFYYYCIVVIAFLLFWLLCDKLSASRLIFWDSEIRFIRAWCCLTRFSPWALFHGNSGYAYCTGMLFWWALRKLSPVTNYRPKIWLYSSESFDCGWISVNWVVPPLCNLAFYGETKVILDFEPFIANTYVADKSLSCSPVLRAPRCF